MFSSRQFIHKHEKSIAISEAPTRRGADLRPNRRQPHPYDHRQYDAASALSPAVHAKPSKSGADVHATRRVEPRRPQPGPASDPGTGKHAPRLTALFANAITLACATR